MGSPVGDRSAKGGSVGALWLDLGSKMAYGGSLSGIVLFLTSSGIKAALVAPTLRGMLSLQDVNDRLF